jgi:hypothetical protein
MKTLLSFAFGLFFLLGSNTLSAQDVVGNDTVILGTYTGKTDNFNIRITLKADLQTISILKSGEEELPLRGRFTYKLKKGIYTIKAPLKVFGQATIAKNIFIYYNTNDGSITCAVLEDNIDEMPLTKIVNPSIPQTK